MTMAGVDLRRKCGAKTTEENGDRWERAGSQDLEFYFRDAEEGGTPPPSGICLGTVGTKNVMVSCSDCILINNPQQPALLLQIALRHSLYTQPCENVNEADVSQM